MKLTEEYGATINLERQNTFGNEIVIVDGQGRSGKNLVSILLSTMDGVEKMRLDSQIDYIPRYYFLGKLSLDAAVTALRLEFDEKYFYNSISRDVNFRWSDYSGVFKQGKRFQYIKRLFLSDNEAIARLKLENPIFQEMTHDGMHLAALYFYALGSRLKFIHVFRDPIENIYEQNLRNFGSRIGVDPREFQLTYGWNGKSIPLMAIGREEEYLGGNKLERLVLMVDVMFRRNIQGYMDLDEHHKKKIFFIDFEDLVSKPDPYLRGLEKFVGKKFGNAKYRVMRRERCPRQLNSIDRDLKIQNIMADINDHYKNILANLIQDYDTKPWIRWAINTEFLEGTN